MSKHFKIYTKSGDDGTTGLVGGSRVKKYNIRLDAYGTVDELNSWIGVIRSNDLDQPLKDLLITIQHKLFIIGSKLATDEKGKPITEGLKITEEDILELEKAIDDFETFLPELSHFILPGGTPLSGFCHVARTVCRRAERKIVMLSENNEVEQFIIQYVNRLSDFLFVLSRRINLMGGGNEIPWNHT